MTTQEKGGPELKGHIFFSKYRFLFNAVMNIAAISLHQEPILSSSVHVPLILNTPVGYIEH